MRISIDYTLVFPMKWLIWKVDSVMTGSKQFAWNEITNRIWMINFQFIRQLIVRVYPSNLLGRETT